MSTPQDPRRADEPVSLDKPPADDVPFDPYRYGAPEHPVPPEYAPPGYRPPQPEPPAQLPPAGYPGFPPTGGYPGSQPPPGHQWSQHSGQPWGQLPYPPPPWATQYPPPRTGNGKAIAGLVLGIVSVLLCWTSIFDVVPVVLAIVFSVMARTEARRFHGGRGMATAGIVLAIVGALLAVTFTVIVYNRIKPCLDSYDQGSTEYNQCIRQRF